VIKAVPKTRRKGHRWLWAVTFGLFLVMSLGGLVLWRAKSFQLLSIQTASMAPQLKTGDAIVTKPVPLSSLKSGDVISYHDPLHASVIITHRIISIDQPKHLVITKGDSAPMADPPFDSTLIIGRVSYGLAKLGYALNFLRSPAGLIIGTYIPALGIVLSELRRLGRVYSRPTYRFAHYIR
jgi:signal peptidase